MIMLAIKKTGYEQLVVSLKVLLGVLAECKGILYEDYMRFDLSHPGFISPLMQFIPHCNNNTQMAAIAPGP